MIHGHSVSNQEWWAQHPVFHVFNCDITPLRLDCRVQAKNRTVEFATADFSEVLSDAEPGHDAKIVALEQSTPALTHFPVESENTAFLLCISQA